MNNITKILCVTNDELIWARWQKVLPNSVRAALERIDTTSGVAMFVDADSIAVGSDNATLWGLAKLLPVVVTASHPKDELGLDVLNAGAVGYTNTFSDAEAFAHVLSVVSAGEVWVGKNLLQRLLKGIQQVSVTVANQVDDLLTVRELEVARLVAKGASNKDIARELDITERTVKAHVSTVLEKLEVNDRLQLALKVNGII
ncbi:response regulator transcription factor [Leeia speluncae]|uniref:response regulator transcription factor n=1 Tax=Leeia speluncae TaxID=2884804 RepID=UPI0025463E5B|nr:response regulator transcription factor [Leeia speluncae]